MPTYSVKVEFIVQAEDDQVNHWSAESCAEDYVRHRIDEGYRLEDRIKDWNFLSIDQIADLKDEEDEE